MHVIIGCRKVQAGLDAIDNLRQCGVMSGSAEVQELDTSSLRSVKMFASAIISKHKNLHLLVNNGNHNLFMKFVLYNCDCD